MVGSGKEDCGFFPLDTRILDASDQKSLTPIIPLSLTMGSVLILEFCYRIKFMLLETFSHIL